MGDAGRVRLVTELLEASGGSRAAPGLALRVGASWLATITVRLTLHGRAEPLRGLGRRAAGAPSDRAGPPGCFP